MVRPPRQALHPNSHYWVGGNTTFYGAALMRLREGDFDETRHAGGVSPAWPIRLADLAPYYAEAETLWQVHGARGVDPDRERRRAALRLSRRSTTIRASRG